MTCRCYNMYHYVPCLIGPDAGTMEYKPEKIASHYLMSHFIIHATAAIPWYVILMIANVNPQKAHTAASK